MIKYILIFACLAYIFRRLITTPIPGSQAYHDHINKQNTNTNPNKQNSTDYTDYEEIK